MATIDVSIKAAKELTELGEGLAKVIGVARKALDDGLGAEDIAPIASSVIMDLVPALEGITLIEDEIKNDLPAAINGICITATRISEEITKKHAS